ncbi:MAG: hypothetical protein V2I33_16995 [Kangiellaceae bacterium]|nr:hypothetical protein [Kangiellaceae bacterium]
MIEHYYFAPSDYKANQKKGRFSSNLELVTPPKPSVSPKAGFAATKADLSDKLMTKFSSVQQAFRFLDKDKDNLVAREEFA